MLREASLRSTPEAEDRSYGKATSSSRIRGIIGFCSTNRIARSAGLSYTRGGASEKPKLTLQCGLFLAVLRRLLVGETSFEKSVFPKLWTHDLEPDGEGHGMPCPYS